MAYSDPLPIGAKEKSIYELKRKHTTPIFISSLSFPFLSFLPLFPPSLSLSLFFFFGLFVFSRAVLRHMKIPRLGVQSEP